MTALMFVGAAVAGGLGLYLGGSGALELIYYRRRRDRADEWKCQPRRFLTPELERSQLLLGTANVLGASIATGLFCHHVESGGATSIYLSLGQRGLVYAVLSTVLYFLVTDAALYWAHRLMHRPALFRAIHRIHHRYTSPTAFTSLAMHPAEFALYQLMAVWPLFVLPVPAAGVVVVLVYHQCAALLAHSGVDLRPWLPGQMPTRFHDDHHVHVHVNFGQTLGIWDRLFGTWRREGRVYGPEVFGGAGALPEGAPSDAPAPLVDYGRRTDGAKRRTDGERRTDGAEPTQ